MAVVKQVATANSANPLPLATLLILVTCVFILFILFRYSALSVYADSQSSMVAGLLDFLIAALRLARLP